MQPVKSEPSITPISGGRWLEVDSAGYHYIHEIEPVKTYQRRRIQWDRIASESIKE